jgi:hypothetical protein
VHLGSRLLRPSATYQQHPASKHTPSKGSRTPVGSMQVCKHANNAPLGRTRCAIVRTHHPSFDRALKDKAAVGPQIKRARTQTRAHTNAWICTPTHNLMAARFSCITHTGKQHTQKSLCFRSVLAFEVWWLRATHKVLYKNLSKAGAP